MRRACRWLFGFALAVTQLYCSDPAAPHNDVDAARRVWLASNVRNYTFEVAAASSWVPRSGFYQVRVADRRVITAVDSAGKPAANFTLTIDEIWDRLLAARAQGQLNSVVFNERGVPIETDMGPWPVDGGVHYSVRSFAPDR